jgi:preprotein translocase subunit SecG
VNIILLVLHVLLSLGIITLVLLQKGAGASAGASFGGGAGSVFGARGSANFLSKSTAVLATAFFINSLALAYLAANRDVHKDSVLDSLITNKQVETVIDKKQASDTDKSAPVQDEKTDATDTDVPSPDDSDNAPAEDNSAPVADDTKSDGDVPPPAGE